MTAIASQHGVYASSVGSIENENSSVGFSGYASRTLRLSLLRLVMVFWAKRLILSGSCFRFMGFEVGWGLLQLDSKVGSTLTYEMVKLK